MSNHDQASPESKALCDALFQGLAKRISNLHRAKVQKWCGFYQTGRKRFVYVNHRKKLERLEVWFLGTAVNSSNYPRLSIRPREPTTGGFGADFEARFFLDSSTQLPDAIALLYQISYAAS